MITSKHYKIPNITEKWLEKNNFRFVPSISNQEDGKFFRYSFPVYRYLDYVTVVGEITVNLESNNAIIDILDQNRARYAPAYYYMYGDFTPLLDEIKTNVDRVIKRLGMVEIDDSEGRDLFDLPVRSTNRRRRYKKSPSVLS